MIQSHPRMSRHVASGRIRLTSIGQDTLSRSEYNSLMTSPEFWRSCLGEKVLIFQTDSIICRSSTYGISDFIDFDYVGAAWPKRFPLCPPHVPTVVSSGRCQGNGGFSLRSRETMIRVCETFEWDSSNEDVFLSSRVPLVGGRVASDEIARHFSVESQLAVALRPFAVHRPHQYLEPKTYNDLLSVCPEATLIASTSTAWKREGQLDLSSTQRWEWGEATDPLSGNFAKEPSHQNIWYVLGSTLFRVESCDACAGENICDQYVAAEDGVFAANHRYVRSARSYACGMSGAYDAVFDVAVRENFGNVASMPLLYHAARTCQRFAVQIDCTGRVGQISFLIQAAADTMRVGVAKTLNVSLSCSSNASVDEGTRAEREIVDMLSYANALGIQTRFGSVENVDADILYLDVRLEASSSDLHSLLRSTRKFVVVPDSAKTESLRYALLRLVLDEFSNSWAVFESPSLASHRALLLRRLTFEM
eukprot:g2614.t1